MASATQRVKPFARGGNGERGEGRKIWGRRRFGVLLRLCVGAARRKAGGSAVGGSGGGRMVSRLRLHLCNYTVRGVLRGIYR